MEEAAQTVEEVEMAEEGVQADEEAGEAEKAKEVIDDLSLPLPSTAPVTMSFSRAGRKRVTIMKVLEAEKAPKRGTELGKNRDCRRDRRASNRANTKFSISIC